MSTKVELDTRQLLSRHEIQAVSELIEAATSVDGVRPLSEHAWLHLRHGGDTHGHHVLATNGSEIVGYAHVDTTDSVEGTSAELVVSPVHRHTGIGRALVQEAIDLSPDGRLRLWAHGEASGARELAHAMSFDTTRSLWQMRRSLFAPLPALEIPDGVRIRTFDVDRDSSAWLDINRRAFVDLPDQSSWTQRDLDMRLAESWFTPEGFFIAESISDSQLLGFHWTKVHGGELAPDGHQHDPMGEIYVLAVDPDTRIPGLGRALSLVGLNYLRSLGLTQAMLYVDANNSRAISLYEGLGFVHWDTDVLYRRG